MAQAIFAAEARKRGLGVQALSAGVYEDLEGMETAREARLICQRRKTPVLQFVSMHVSKVDAPAARRIFVMSHNHIPMLVETLKLSAERIRLLGQFDPQKRGEEIEDPFGQDGPAFERCYERMRDCIVHYLDTTEDFKLRRYDESSSG